MSKSDTDKKSCINITDEPDEILEKCKKAITDFTSEITYDPTNRPGVSNLITMHSLISNKSIEEICNDTKSLDTGKYKYYVADAIIEHFKPIREKILDYMENPDYLVDLLEIGQERATEIAERTMIEVRDRIGLGINTKSSIPAKLYNEL